jgi:hypothetical protein
MTTTLIRSFLSLRARRTPDALRVTRPQVDRVIELNRRSAPERQNAIGRGHDLIELVEDSDERAAMIGGIWFGMTIGILPDGSSHS